MELADAAVENAMADIVIETALLCPPCEEGENMLTLVQLQDGC